MTTTTTITTSTTTTTTTTTTTSTTSLYCMSDVNILFIYVFYVFECVFLCLSGLFQFVYLYMFAYVCLRVGAFMSVCTSVHTDNVIDNYKINKFKKS